MIDKSNCLIIRMLPKDVSITHLTFGKEFTHAIEQKQVAQQEAERQKFVVMKAEQERKVHFAKEI